MTTPNALGRSIRELMHQLVSRELVLLNNSVAIEGDLVWWRSPTPLAKFVDFADYPTIGTYRRWVEASEYLALLPDGGLLQLRYSVVDGEIKKHRLAYIPCPYLIDRDFLLTDGLIDVLDIHLDVPHEQITMQTAVRFDYDPGAAGAHHPSAHMTLNVASCRIACEAPMTPEDFVRFVFRNFYADDWLANRSFFDGLPKSDLDSTVQDEERLSPHVAWRREIAS